MIGDKLIKTAGTNNEQYSGWGVEGDATQATRLGYSSFYQGGDYGKEIKPDGGWGGGGGEQEAEQCSKSGCNGNQ